MKIVVVGGTGLVGSKPAREKAPKAAGIPWTILRATQFFELIDGIADSGTRFADWLSRSARPADPRQHQPEGASA